MRVVALLVLVFLFSSCHTPQIQKENKVSPYPQVVNHDRSYDALTKDEWEKIKADWNIYRDEVGLKYTDEKFDCDDFSFVFKSFCIMYNAEYDKNIAVAMVLSIQKGEGPHMLNGVLVEKDFLIFEPQLGLDVISAEYEKYNKLVRIIF